MLLLCLAALAAEPDSDTDAPVDPALTEVQDVLTAVDRFEQVKASMDGDVLRLEGSVESVEARNEIEALAGRVDALFVDNLIEVESGPGDDPPGPALDDAAIRVRLTRVFSQIPALNDVTVSVEGGVVKLGGEVLDSENQERAVQLAEKLDGVLFVYDATEVTTDVSGRLLPAFDSVAGQIRSILAKGPLILIALLIVGAFWLLGRAISGWSFLFKGISDRPLVRAMIGQLVRVVFIVIGLLIALEILDATSLVGAVVGAAGVLGVALGFAFQDIVENYLAGLLLSIQQPFSKDDLVEVDGVRGVVLRLTTRNTLLLTEEGNHVYLPNSTVFKSQLTNFSRNPFRRFDFTVGVGVEEDLVEVVAVGTARLDAMEGVTADPAPAIRIEELGDSSVVMHVYAWVDQRTHSYLAVRTEAIRQIKDAYDIAEFDMPEPIYRVSMTQVQPKPPKPKKVAASAPEAMIDLRADDELVKQAAEQRRLEDEVDLLNS